ncbi:hypothetical protein ASPCADRAFT_208470 [Aspergillus carbonarius ITEM 5010]|uniref:Uncharacterized protein n=1 Tax=Aspergillus carbonarius (strain ITEM 5010) TaxID=602072 RepID=A0A1R3RK04_ASPC5|nr:hypothetical protein ASPCADRAFT_208470 [Aspergillus carbonarius ITEM 5010]
MPCRATFRTALVYSELAVSFSHAYNLAAQEYRSGMIKIRNNCMHQPVIHLPLDIPVSSYNTVMSD